MSLPGAAVDQVVAGAPDQTVVVIAAVKTVVAGAAGQRVGPGRPGQHVVAAVAGQAVGIGRAGDILDAGQRVAGRVVAAVDAGRKVHRHRTGGAGVIGGVDAQPAVDHVRTAAADQDVVVGAAVKRIRAGPARQRIVARRPPERVVAGVAHQRVVVGRSRQIGDAVEDVAGRVAHCAGIGRQRGRNRAAGGGIIGGIDARAAVKRIRPGAAGQGIIAAKAGDGIGTRSADQGIIPRSAGNRCHAPALSCSVRVFCPNPSRLDAEDCAAIVAQVRHFSLPAPQVAADLMQKRLCRAADLHPTCNSITPTPALPHPGGGRRLTQPEAGLLATAGGSWRDGPGFLARMP